MKILRKLFGIIFERKDGVNFINLLRAHLSYEILVPKTTKLAFGFEILAPKILYKKRTKKTLMKLTTGCSTEQTAKDVELKKGERDEKLPCG